MVLDLDTMGQTMCGGGIGSLGTICIKLVSKCSVSLHKNKVNISVPALFVTQSDKAFTTPSLSVLDVSMVEVEGFPLQKMSILHFNL